MTLSFTELSLQLFEGLTGLKRVLFRVDAGCIPGLSFGHLSRCTHLSRALQRQGVSTALLMQQTPDGMEHARALGEHLRPATAQSVRCSEAQALVLDMPYDVDMALVEAAHAQNMRLIWIDDTGRSHLQADIVVNSSILAQQAEYPHAKMTLLGPSYFPIAHEDRLLAEVKVVRTLPARRVCMTFGGSDPTGLTLRVLKAFADSHFRPQLEVVLGPGFAPALLAPVRALAEQCAARVLQAPCRLLPILYNADMVVCSGGRTMYECHALHIPMLAVGSTPDEAVQVETFRQQGLLLSGLATWDEHFFIKEISQYVCKH